MRHKALGSWLLAFFCLAAGAQAPAPAIKLGVLSDYTASFSSWGGKGSVLATQMAFEDFKRANPDFGYRIEIVQADFQLKPDLAVAIARKWMDEGVNAILDLPSSSAALAVNTLLKGSATAALMNGASTDDLVTKGCSPNLVHWTYDLHSIGGQTVKALADRPGKTFFLITQDSVAGKQLESVALEQIASAAGKAIGGVKSPLGTRDFSSALVSAQASRADVVLLLQGGADTVSALKQAQEFGLAQGGQKLGVLWALLPDIKAMGLSVAQGLVFVEAFYWDADDNARAFAKRFAERYDGKAPTAIQAGAYSVVTHYLKGVAAARTLQAPAVVAHMKKIPVQDQALGKGVLRQDGRMVHDLVLVQVKTAAESRGAWDLYRVLRTIPGDAAFRPASPACAPAAS